MNIDPLKVPCPFCDDEGQRVVTVKYGEEIECTSCEARAFDGDWVFGGINAMVGKLTRKGVFVWESPEGWTWDSEDEEGKAWQTFEYCVLDAWEKMEMREEENGLRGGGPSL